LAAKSTNAAVKSQWQELEQHLQTLTREKEFKSEKLIVDVEKGKSIIDQLSERLSARPKGF
ncbi:MAG TPA: hypothetical protein VM012_14280, partial [Flavitalea sp.]|nr:hypothetical protein [Flavitalea sp.]